MKIGKEIVCYIRENAKGKTNLEMTEMVNQKFNSDFSVTQIKSAKSRNKISSGLTGCFEKGHSTWNKGKKGYFAPGTEKTRFQKGHKNANTREVGSERITKDGYIEVKVAEPNVWRLKHAVVFERENGKIPKNCSILFLDGDKKNTDISNLKIVLKSELLIMNRQHMLSDDAKINDSVSNLAKLIDKTNKVKKQIIQN